MPHLEKQKEVPILRSFVMHFQLLVVLTATCCNAIHSPAGADRTRQDEKRPGPRGASKRRRHDGQAKCSHSTQKYASYAATDSRLQPESAPTTADFFPGEKIDFPYRVPLLS